MSACAFLFFSKPVGQLTQTAASWIICCRRKPFRFLQHKNNRMNTHHLLTRSGALLYGQESPLPTVQLPRGAPSWPSLAPLSNRRTDLMEQGRSRVADEEKTIIQEATDHIRIPRKTHGKHAKNRDRLVCYPDLSAPGARAPTQPRRVSSSGQTNKWRYDVRLTQRRQTNLSENT